MLTTEKQSFDAEWFCIKLPFTVIWLVIMHVMISAVESCLYPTGICGIHTFEWMFTPIGKIGLYAAMAAASLLNLTERKMLLATTTLSLISIVVISFHESNGIYFRATILSLVWLGQWFAYARKHFNPRFNIMHYRQQYVWQMIVAVYVLAGIAKVNAAGLGWGWNADGFALQIIKNFAFAYYETADEKAFQSAVEIANFFAAHPALTGSMLTAALLLELFCFLALANEKLRMIFGIGLLLMHIGIAWFMGIGISVICFPMVFFFLNPLYKFIQSIQWLNNQFSAKK